MIIVQKKLQTIQHPIAMAFHDGIKLKYAVGYRDNLPAFANNHNNFSSQLIARPEKS